MNDESPIICIISVCDECHEYVPGDCEIHGPYNWINDRKAKLVSVNPTDTESEKSRDTKTTLFQDVYLKKILENIKTYFPSILLITLLWVSTDINGVFLPGCER